MEFRCFLIHLFTAFSGLSISLSASADPAVEDFETGLRPAVEVMGQPAERWTLEERMAHWKVPGVSVAVIRNGKLAWAKGYGVLRAGGREPVDAETVFSVGSVSKVAAAAVTLRLVDAGKLEIHRNVNEYLSRWQIPENAYTAVRPVTLRGILSHSAGLTVSGFPDFLPGEPLPTVVDTLEGRPPARTEAVRVDYLPGSRTRYSGGGITVEQLVIEEITGLDFPAAAREWVFEPLGMHRSTFRNPLPPSHGNIAKAHDADGNRAALPRGWETMPEMAASGLWTTPSDYARLVTALMKSYDGNEDPFLSRPIARQMMTEVGASIYGLGPKLTGVGVDRVFSHGGANASYRAWMEGHLATGDGVVIFTNGSNGHHLHPEIRRAVAAAEGWSVSGSVIVPDIELSDEALRELEGTYAVQHGDALSGLRLSSWAGEMIAVRIAVDRGYLHLRLPGDDREMRLVAEGITRFIDARTGNRCVEFVRGYSGQIERLVLRRGMYSVEAVRLP